MMNFKTLYIFLVLLGLVSCVSDIDNLRSGDTCEIRLYGNLDNNTTRADVDIQNTAIAQNQNVRVFTFDADDNSNLDNAVFKAGALSDGKVPLNKTDKTLYFPKNGHQVKVFAFHPAEKVPATISSFTSFKVEADQSTETNYKQSDLMMASVTSADRTSTIELPFTHMLAKFAFHISSPNLTITQVVLKNAYRQFAITDPLTYERGDLSDLGDVIAYSDGTGASSVDCAILIPQQSFIPETNTLEISVTTNKGTGVFYFPNTLATGRGKVLHFNLIVNERTLLCRSKIIWKNTGYGYSEDYYVKSPLEYVAVGNVRGIGMTGWQFDDNNSLTGSYYYTFAKAKQNFDSSVLCADGNYYYLPTINDWYSVFPADNIMTTGTTTRTESGVVVNQESLANFQSEFKKVDNQVKVFALRYKGTKYYSAWCYEVNSNCMLMRTIPLNPNVTYTIDQINDSFFNTYSSCVISRILPAAGRVSGSSMPSSGVSSGPPDNTGWGDYSSGTLSDGSNLYNPYFRGASDLVFANDTDPVSSGLTVRLFQGYKTSSSPAGKFYSSASTEDLGKVMTDDGYMYNNSRDALNAGKTPIGIVAYVNDGTAKGNALTEKDAGAGHVLVMALHDCGEGPDGEEGALLDWAIENYQNEDLNNSLFPNITDIAGAKTDYKGLEKTNSLYANKNRYPTAKAAKEYNVSISAASTGWFLPSVAQMIAMATSLGGISESSLIWGGVEGGTTTFANINQYLSRAGSYTGMTDNRDYWTSSESYVNSKMRACYIGVTNSTNGDKFYVHSDVKSAQTNNYTRPFVAF